MGHHIIVCPAEPSLVIRLRGRAVVLRVPSTEALDEVIGNAKRAELLLHCIVVESRHPLGLLTLEERWKDIPIALHVPSLGRLRDIVRLMPLIHQMNIRVVLPADSAENLTGLRILASLGVACIAAPGSGRIPWDAFGDLATYALLGLVPHGPIEPYEHLAKHYDPNKRTDFRGVWFEDPTRFVHMDQEGRFAFSSDELARGTYAGMSPEDVDAIDDSDTYRERIESWRQVFLDQNGCASCPGWRICLGAFEATARTDPRCRTCFAEILDVIERRQSATHNGHRELWPV